MDNGLTPHFDLARWILLPVKFELPYLPSSGRTAVRLSACG
jgi:hypothetical protein